MKMLEPGVHRARATQRELGKNQRGNSQVALVFKILEGPFQGETVRYYGVLTEKTRDFVLRGLTLCGWTVEVATDDKTLVGVCDNQVDIYVIHEKFDGRRMVNVSGSTTLREPWRVSP